MNTTLIIFQIIVSIILIFLIAIQGKGGGLGSAFGSSAGAFHERRGVEKFVFQLTIGLTALFLITSVANLLV
ncbi:preprotein translocase subunit SecG [Candidatus Roizmanbacteria bacterium]|nr:preprotein translocase subunit SecG [Candidatus Roizmanbacteria bacterium]